MPVKSIGKTNYTSRPMEKTNSMNKNVADNNNKAHYNKVSKKKNNNLVFNIHEGKRQQRTFY